MTLRLAGSLAGAGASHNNYFYWLSTSASNTSRLFLQNGGRPRGIAVDSDMNRVRRHGALPPPSLLTPPSVAAAVVGLIEELTPERAAHSLGHEGHDLRW